MRRGRNIKKEKRVERDLLRIIAKIIGSIGSIIIFFSFSKKWEKIKINPAKRTKAE
jgi:hypothetical protein